MLSRRSQRPALVGRGSRRSRIGDQRPHFDQVTRFGVLGVDNHCAELEHRERLSVEPHVLRSIEHGTTAVQFDEDRHDEEERPQQQQPDSGAHIYRAMVKTGTTSRDELAALLPQHRP